MKARIVPKPDCHYQDLDQYMQPGDLIESPYPNVAMVDCWLFCCPQCKKVWTMRVPYIHQIVNRDPLTVAPSWLCPSGCHFWIRDGEVTLA